jgi:competence ComEA-like helix-hairpin-helix protein
LDSAVIDSFILSLENIKAEEINIYLFPKTETKFLEPKPFDPNLVSDADLTSMGFPPVISHNLIRYREAGGSFRNKEDIRKLYGMNDSVYDHWAEFIILNEIKEPVSVPDNQKVVKSIVPDLNSADSSELVKINGIGPYFASKIISYRKKLGGFSGPKQLLEIRGMDENILRLIMDQAIIDTLKIKRLDLNHSSLSDFIAHPYISKRIAEGLVEYRDFAGQISTMDELVNNRILNSDELLKLRPYLSIAQ